MSGILPPFLLVRKRITSQKFKTVLYDGIIARSSKPTILFLFKQKMFVMRIMCFFSDTG